MTASSLKLSVIPVILLVKLSIESRLRSLPSPEGIGLGKGYNSEAEAKIFTFKNCIKEDLSPGQLRLDSRLRGKCMMWNLKVGS